MPLQRLYVSAVALAALALGGASAAGAQELAPPRVSDSELRSFAAVYVEVRELQAELQDEIDRTLRESELNAARFSQIDELARRHDNTEQLPNVGADELEEYERVLDALDDVQQTTQERMLFVLEERELTVDRYNEIMVAAQQNPNLMERAQEYIDEERANG